MAKEFDPLEYNYELVNKDEDVFHFQKKLLTNELAIIDVIELAYWSKQKIWIIFVDVKNLKQFFKGPLYFEDDMKITLFIGEIKNDFDYQYLLKRICIKPEILVQLGS